MVKPLEIGVCSWSIDRHYIVRSLDMAANRLALRAVQIGFFTEEAVRNADSADILRTATTEGVNLCGSFVGFEGEDYSSIETIAETGGYAPDDCWPARLAMTRRVGELTAAVGTHLLAVHAGTIPDDRSSPLYARLVERVREVAEAMAENNVRLLLETGRESAQVLLDFIEAVDRPNIGVNFDPANFVIYGTDDPARAVNKLKGHIELAHMKDAFASARPGDEFGRPAPLGGGDAAIPRVVNKLRAARYAGPLLLECRPHDLDFNGIQASAEYLRSLVT
jgi:sugar phosphate isomerase/epimerase